MLRHAPFLACIPRLPTPTIYNILTKMDRPPKRLKKEPDTSALDASRTSPLPSLARSITPPPSRSQQPLAPAQIKPKSTNNPNSIPSPFQLTHIQAQSGSQSGNNVDTVRLGDILGDPMIRECWQFNYMIDVDFLMRQFDEDVRDLVQVKVVHGSWKREDGNRIAIEVFPTNCVLTCLN